MHPDNAFIHCLRCGCQNPLGMDRCRRCGASLPPPEALLPHQGPARGGRRSSWVIAVFSAAVLGLGALLFLTRIASGPPIRPGVPPFSGTGPAPSASVPAAPAGQDPLIEEAQRTIRRLQEEHGLTPPPADDAGRVHLRSGGSISAEEWERAARSLQAHP